MGPVAPNSQGKSRQIDTNGQFSGSYGIDVRLLNCILPSPSLFSSALEMIIQEAEDIAREIEPHQLQKFMINSIDSRFTRLNHVDEDAIDRERSVLEILKSDLSRFEEEQWYQLTSSELFWELFLSIRKQYYCEKALREFMNGRGTTIQKEIQVRQPEQMTSNLVIRLFLHYYISLLKEWLASSEEKNFMLRFHSRTGKNLIFVVLYNNLELEQIFELAYRVIFIAKHNRRLAHEGFDKIVQKYQPLCLKTEHRVRVSKMDFQKYQTTTRLYLNQLYLRSVREAEDPDIRQSDDALMPTNIFPINRVKEKNK